MFWPPCKRLPKPTKLCAAASTTKNRPTLAFPASYTAPSAAFILEVKQPQERGNSPAPKDADILSAVFLYPGTSSH